LHYPKTGLVKVLSKNLQFALITHSPKNKIKCPNYTRSHSIVIKKRSKKQHLKSAEIFSKENIHNKR
ncbi:MAG: hypothetical protein E7H03_09205, partial [Staphylococcus epidermidis]|nr:hypothetical protein [Staphylococcus epidermidis]MDU3969857.1 hypothetical protein [Staphylococcus epidermidis]